MGPPLPPPHTRRLARQLVSIAQAACDLQEPGIASELLEVAESFLRSAVMAPKDRFDISEQVVAMHHRLWHLRCTDSQVARDANAPHPADAPPGL